MEFFCGSGPECQSATNQNEEAEYKTRMLEKAKQRVLNDYFVIGVLEQFEDSLRVFEKLLPRYYRGALDVYHSKSKSYCSFTAFRTGGNEFYYQCILWYRMVTEKSRHSNDTKSNEIAQ